MRDKQAEPKLDAAIAALLMPLVRALAANGAMKTTQLDAIVRQLRDDCDRARSPQERADIGYAADLAAILAATLHDQRVPARKAGLTLVRNEDEG